MSLSEKVQYFARTDVGRLRDHNEDNYLVDKKLSLSVVADGMGGHAAGEVASAVAVEGGVTEALIATPLVVPWAIATWQPPT